MTNTSAERRRSRLRRHRRVRKKIVGTADRPRLAVYRSNRHTAVQIIDDTNGRTLVAASTLEPDLRSSETTGVSAAAAVGRLAAERAAGSGITTVVFDRGGYRYHGRVAAVADAAREAGMKL